MERREGARGLRGPLGNPCDRAARAPCEAGCAPLALHLAASVVGRRAAPFIARSRGGGRWLSKREHDKGARARGDKLAQKFYGAATNVKCTNFEASSAFVRIFMASDAAALAA